jgi:hypothetical protein
LKAKYGGESLVSSMVFESFDHWAEIDPIEPIACFGNDSFSM